MSDSQCNDHFQRPDTQYIPFYHERCPNCGYCRYCGRKDEPFKDHWAPPLPQPYIGDPVPYPYYTNTTNGSDPQATIPLVTSQATAYADVDGQLRPRV